MSPVETPSTDVLEGVKDKCKLTTKDIYANFTGELKDCGTGVPTPRLTWGGCRNDEWVIVIGVLRLHKGTFRSQMYGVDNSLCKSLCKDDVLHRRIRYHYGVYVFVFSLSLPQPSPSLTFLRVP